MNKFIIHAPNIHQGGGKTLLLPLLLSLNNKVPVVAFLDERLSMPNINISGLTIIDVKSSISGRIIGEYELIKYAKEGDTVLCFGNLPPALKLKSEVILFLQNSYLVNNISLDGFSLKNKIRILLERFWLSFCNKNADRVIVQTVSMQRSISLKLNRKSDVIPFYDSDADEVVNSSESEKIYDFVYVASGEPQKNHLNLIEAWKILAKENIYPSLCLTLSSHKYHELVRYVNDSCKKDNLNIYNRQEINQVNIKDIYSCSQALIFPSTVESFGLPLIEAKAASLPIIASELDYVRDVVVPDVTFDPNSPVSISRAVKRFMKINQKIEPIITSEEFLRNLIPSFEN